MRADALAALADIVGGDGLGQRVRTLFVEHPPPLDAAAPDAVSALRATSDSDEQAAMLIAARLDAA